MKLTREPSRRSLTAEYCYLQAMGLGLFPGSIVQVAGLPSKMGSFSGSLLNIKNKLASFSQFRPGRDRVQRRRQDMAVRRRGSRLAGRGAGFE